MQRRLRSEFTDFNRNPIENCTVCIAGDDIKKWRVCVLGPIGSPYENGRLEMLISMPNDYPF